MTNPTEIVAGRYGSDRPKRRRVAVALGSLIAAALTAWAVWAALSLGNPAIDATVTAYDVVDTHEVRVKVTLHLRDTDTAGSCLLRATAEDHTVVGELNLTTAELRSAKGTWISLRTERRATTATVVRCSS